MQTASSQLEHLFSLELKYQGPVELAPMGEKVGKLVGGGDGTLKGPKIKGTVRWSNYETTGQDEVCSLQVPGVIQTDDGARIQFEGREFAMPAANSPKRWSVAGVTFRTEDDRYKWLNKIFALAKGTFDYESGDSTMGRVHGDVTRISHARVRCAGSGWLFRCLQLLRRRAATPASTRQEG